MSGHATFHDVRRLRAWARGTREAPLTMEFWDRDCGAANTVTLFMDDHALANRLRDAINRTMDEWRAEQPAESTE